MEWQGTGPEGPYLITRPTPKDKKESNNESDKSKDEDEDQDKTPTKGCTEEEEEERMALPVTNYSTVVLPKEKGLFTLSRLLPSQWRLLFHLKLVPKELPKKSPSAPFFLQW